MSTAALRATNAGVELAYEVRGDGPPLLLVQGLGYGGSGWGGAHELLAESFGVVSFDNRGFGRSDSPPGPYSVADLAADTAAVLDAAGLDRAHVLGVSLGGMVAQELALTRPERIDRLVLVSTTPGGAGSFPMPQRTMLLLATAATLAPSIALERFVDNALGESPAAGLAERIVAYRTANPPDPAGWASQAAAGAAFDALDRIGGIAASTLVLHGTADAVVDPRNGELLAGTIPGARLELFAGDGHLLSWEQPERFARLVTEFLQ